MWSPTRWSPPKKKKPANVHFNVRDKVVYCPDSPTVQRGAVGIVESRTMKGKKGKGKRLFAFVVKWVMYRVGTVEVRVRGRRRKKSNGFQNDSKGSGRMYIRHQEEAHGYHPMVYCQDCPLRLSRLLAPCPRLMTKPKAQRNSKRVKNE